MCESRQRSGEKDKEIDITHISLPPVKMREGNDANIVRHQKDDLMTQIPDCTDQSCQIENLVSPAVHFDSHCSTNDGTVTSCLHG